MKCLLALREHYDGIKRYDEGIDAKGFVVLERSIDLLKMENDVPLQQYQTNIINTFVQEIQNRLRYSAS